MMTPASIAAKHDPQSSLQRYFGAAMERVSAFLAFMDEITLESVRAYWGRRMSFSPYGRLYLQPIANGDRWTISAHSHRKLLHLLVFIIIRPRESPHHISPARTLP